jgi:hypothetical protein
MELLPEFLLLELQFQAIDDFSFIANAESGAKLIHAGGHIPELAAALLLRAPPSPWPLGVRPPLPGE